MEKKRKIPVFKIIFGLLVAGFVVMVLSGNKTWFADAPPIQVIPDMDHQFKVEPQVETHFFSDRTNERMPVENTVPRNGSVYNIDKADVDAAETRNVNTSVPQNEFVLARGQNRFNTMCSPCHGYKGLGDGTVAKRGFPPPPSFIRPETKALSDARIYHIISAGQNVMPSYADKLAEQDRWAVVQYVRHLQGMQGGGMRQPAPQPVADTAAAPSASIQNRKSVKTASISQVP